MKKLLKIFGFIVLFIFSSFILIGYVGPKFDPYIAYHSLSKSPPKEKTLNYFQPVDDLIKNKLTENISSREKAIIEGLRFVVRMVDDEKKFDFIFPSFILLVYEMIQSHGRIHQKEVAELTLRMSLARAQNRLNKIFPLNSEERKWQLIGMFHILHHYAEYSAPYFDFYRRHFLSSTHEPVHEIAFKDAIKQRSYKTIGHYLINLSFLHYYLRMAKNLDFPLPQDRFLEYLKDFEAFDYDFSHEPNSEEFVDSGFLATHVILVLTNYGQFPIKNDINKQKAQKYIDDTLDKTRFQLGYLDLLAEYLQCLKILHTGQKHIAELEKLLFELQRPDGSWGTARDFNSNPYNAFHPTWAVLTALNHENP